jgi:hypothetical protein
MKKTIYKLLIFLFIFFIWNIFILGVIDTFDNSGEILKYLFIYFGPICGIFISGSIVSYYYHEQLKK